MPKNPNYPQYEMDLEGLFEPVVNVLKASLIAKIQGHLVTVYLSADRELVTWGQTLGGLPIAYEGPPMEQAIKWAKDYAAKLVTKMDEETKTRLAQVVSDAIENKRGIPGLAREIRNEFADMTKYRSRTIARTETAKALSQGNLERMRNMGVDGKQWYGGADPCAEICQPNIDEGIIPVDQAFSSGDDAPPGHPNCACACAPARLANREE